MATDSLKLQVNALLTAVGKKAAEFQLAPLAATGNNRVYSLCSDKEKLILKWYFHDAEDKRNRLSTEYDFLEHAWKIGLRCIPRPVGRDLESQLAIHEFIDGQKLGETQVTEDAVQQAAQFLAELNSVESRVEATNKLNAASEACFSISEHLAMVDARIERLNEVIGKAELNHAATMFIQRLVNFWNNKKEDIKNDCVTASMCADATLPSASRCLSPSDFGFHNAILRPNGKLCFIDFEYAGWDDPAKAVGDFFAQPAVAVPEAHFELFMERVIAPFGNTAEMSARVRILRPVFQVKWCCIILNEFLPLGAKRRIFADPGIDADDRKEFQLAKAEKYFNSLQN